MIINVIIILVMVIIISTIMVIVVILSFVIIMSRFYTSMNIYINVFVHIYIIYIDIIVLNHLILVIVMFVGSLYGPISIALKMLSVRISNRRQNKHHNGINPICLPITFFTTHDGTPRKIKTVKSRISQKCCVGDSVIY